MCHSLLCAVDQNIFLGFFFAGAINQDLGRHNKRLHSFLSFFLFEFGLPFKNAGSEVSAHSQVIRSTTEAPALMPRQIFVHEVNHVYRPRSSSVAPVNKTRLPAIASQYELSRAQTNKRAWIWNKESCLPF